MTCIGNYEYFHSFSLLFGKRFFSATNSLGSTIIINLLLRDSLSQHVVRSERVWQVLWCGCLKVFRQALDK